MSKKLAVSILGLALLANGFALALPSRWNHIVLPLCLVILAIGFSPMIWVSRHPLNKKQKAAVQTFLSRQGSTKAGRMEMEKNSNFAAKCLCWLIIALPGLAIVPRLPWGAGWRLAALLCFCLVAIPPAAYAGTYLTKARIALFRKARRNMGLDPEPPPDMPSLSG